MATNKKKTSNGIGSKASKILTNPNSSVTAKKLAGSALSQTNTRKKQTGSKLEDLASRVLTSPKYNSETKSLAASVLSQSNKKR